MTAPRQRPARALLSRSVVVTAVVGLLCCLVAGLVRGLPGLWGAALATVVVVLFLLVGQLPISTAARGRSGLAAVLLLLLYVVRIWLLLAAYAVVVTAGDNAVDRESVGATLILAALAWTAATVWTAMRWRPTLIDSHG